MTRILNNPKVILFCQSFKLLLSKRPDVIVGFGGYATFPICLMGRILNIPVIIHDVCFSRTTQKKSLNRINEMNFSEIKKIDIGSWFHKKFSTETILSLEEFLCHANGKVGVMLDLKEETILNKKQIIKVGSIIKEYYNSNNQFQLLVGSLKSEILYTIKEMIPEEQLLPIVEFEWQLREYNDLQTKIYALHYPIARKMIVNNLKARGIEVWAWVVDDTSRAKKLIANGINGLITNTPRLFLTQNSG